jgi:Kdo2-lipid IVA lauroyltransferase/acyltransferase
MKAGLLRIVLWLIGLLPARGLYWLSFPLGRLTWAMSATKRATTLRNLAAAYPDMPGAERDHLARESMRHYTQSILEVGLFWSWGQQRILRRFDSPVGIDLLDVARAEGRGVLLLLPHFGAWEPSVHALQPRYPLVALYKPGSSSTVEAAMLQRRQRFGTRMAATDRSGLRAIYQELNDGGIVVQLPDQVPSSGQGRQVPFFGVPALTGVLAPRLIQRTDCRVLLMACARSGPGRYQLHFLEPEPEVYSEDIDTALAAVNRGVEACIAIDPAQYLWAYKRYKSRPEGEPRFYAR